ncbi:hypothetical protein B0J12DRAFT_713740 [Macrophomina phaseolina]|uniref:Oxidase ustYa n=1 Tax=Macrophomina phaseolina TaxID=35725 RepID=A0ABQ8FX62_9PEZI|nr:hypothetical protein B0J12DRAFT_713740 [Macrophomina phaseolina]
MYFLVAFLALGWLLTAAYSYHDRPLLNRPLRTYRESPIPQEVLNPVKKVFYPDERYICKTNPCPEVNHEWDKLVAGHDNLWVEDPERWNLGPGTPAPWKHPNMPKEEKFYVISILHQLHCLNMVRFWYYEMKHGVNTSTVRGADKWDEHLDHCWEYLRLGISCGGDLMIEPYSPSPSDATLITGWGVEHECIDFERLRQYQIEQERKYNETWQTPGIDIRA